MGHSAKNQEIQNYKNTISGFREFLGRKLTDPLIQNEIKNLPFEVIPQEGDSIGFKVSLLVELPSNLKLKLPVLLLVLG